MAKIVLMAILSLICINSFGDGDFTFNGKRAFPNKACELAVNGGMWYGFYTDSSNANYLVCASIESTNYMTMLSFPTNSIKSTLGGGGFSVEEVINSEAFTNAVLGVSLNPSPAQEDIDELSSYGTFGSIGAVLATLIAAVASLHRRRLRQDDEGNYYFEVDEE